MRKKSTDLSIDYPSAEVLHKARPIDAAVKVFKSPTFLGFAVSFFLSSSAPWWLAPIVDNGFDGFPDAGEIKSMSFARINLTNAAEDGTGNDELIGLLYVTNCEQSAFNGSLTNLIVIVCELLSLILERIAICRVDTYDEDVDV